jgi:hypothetical protein
VATIPSLIESVLPMMPTTKASARLRPLACGVLSNAAGIHATALMTSLAIGTAIGAAALTVGRGALGAVGNGLSFASELMRATAAGTPQANALADRAAVAKDVIQQRVTVLRQRIMQAFAMAGIQLSQSMELISDGHGGIAVAGPHPQQAAIEEALGSDVLLERDFQQLASDYDDLVAAGATSELPPMFSIAIPVKE